jgi:hypothetical protein
VPTVTAPSAPQPKTLPHALGRGAAQASNLLAAASPSAETRLGQALKEYALAYDKIGAARLDHDDGVHLPYILRSALSRPSFHSYRGSLPGTLAGDSQQLNYNRYQSETGCPN